MRQGPQIDPIARIHQIWSGRFVDSYVGPRRLFPTDLFRESAPSVAIPE